MRRFAFSTKCSTSSVMRGYVHAYYRMPLKQSIPTHNKAGEEIDVDLFVDQIKRLFETLKQSQLVESIYEMKSLPYFESVFVADLVASMKSVIYVMPKYSREHRSSEMSETMRYLRGSGASNDFNSTLQDARGAAAHGGDFVATTHGLLMGWGTNRTNKIAMEALTGTSEEGKKTIGIDPIELKPGSPQLADLISFAGSRTLLARDDSWGREAVAQAVRNHNKVPWQVVNVEPGCSVLSFASGTLPVYDVLCDENFPDTMGRLGEAGLNPFPVDWSEHRKLGITMRSLMLIARFSIGAGPGGFRDSMSHQASPKNYYSTKNPRIANQHSQRAHGDQGAPLLAQIRMGEIPEPVNQRPPRYRPPMHREGQLATTPDTS